MSHDLNVWCGPVLLVLHRLLHKKKKWISQQWNLLMPIFFFLLNWYRLLLSVLPVNIHNETNIDFGQQCGLLIILWNSKNISNRILLIERHRSFYWCFYTCYTTVFRFPICVEGVSHLYSIFSIWQNDLFSSILVNQFRKKAK